MKEMVYKILLFSLLLLPSCVVAEKDYMPEQQDEMVGLSFTLPLDAYGAGTKADDPYDPLGLRPWTPSNVPYRNIPQESIGLLHSSITVRLIIRQIEDANGTRLTNGLVLNRSFVSFGSAANGDIVLRPCNVDGKGKFLDYDQSNLLVPAGKYMIYAMSPAIPVMDNSGKVRLASGDSFMANDWRYPQTVPTVVTVSPGTAVNNLVQVRLNPMIHQTAKLILGLYTDNLFINSVDLVNAGVTVSGLQSPSYYGSGDSGYSMSMNDTLKVSWTNHNSSLNLANKTEVMEKFRYTINGVVQDIELPVFYVSSEILPTDCSATPVNVSFSGKVNGVPANFTYNLDGKIFKPGYYYKYIGKLVLQNGVYLVEWQFISYSIDTYIYQMR